MPVGATMMPQLLPPGFMPPPQPQRPSYQHSRVYAYNEDRKKLLNLPREICSPTVGLMNYDSQTPEEAQTHFRFQLCRRFHQTGSCLQVEQCEFIHSTYPNIPQGLSAEVTHIDVHSSTAPASDQELPYAVHPPGEHLTVVDTASRRRVYLASEQCYITNGSKFGIENKHFACQHCTHYLRGTCARGSECNFIHRIPVPGTPKAGSAAQQQRPPQLPPPPSPLIMSGGMGQYMVPITMGSHPSTPLSPAGLTPSTVGMMTPQIVSFNSAIQGGGGGQELMMMPVQNPRSPGVFMMSHQPAFAPPSALPGPPMLAQPQMVSSNPHQLPPGTLVASNQQPSMVAPTQLQQLTLNGKTYMLVPMEGSPSGPGTPTLQGAQVHYSPS